jgi:hypothetical protein
MKVVRTLSVLFTGYLNGLLLQQGEAFAFPIPQGTTRRFTTTIALSGVAKDATDTGSDLVRERYAHHQPVLGGILLLDHLNINHEKGRHDWLTAFYFDFLKLAVDPRKQDNVTAGTKTVWANAGAHQFHLPEGKPDAQVFDGRIVLVYPDLTTLRKRVHAAQDKLQGSKFDVMETQDDALLVTDPWGSRFRLEEGSEEEYRDPRGRQPGGVSECLAMRDLTVFTPSFVRLEGIARFYQHVFGAPIQCLDNHQCVVSVGPKQTLTFEKKKWITDAAHHTDLRQENVEVPDGYPIFPSNYGPHVSMYVADFSTCYQKAQEMGLAYVNPRFKRRAYNLDQAIDDCMFRCLDIVDPEQPEEGVILQLEHEVRSVVTRDGSLYKSCPFDKLPETMA